MITIDGADGTVMLGAVPTVDPQLSGDFATLMEWADAHRRLKVRTNAETPLDARTARQVRRRGHRPVPHRAHVLPARPDRRHAGDDPGRRRRGPDEGAGQDPADAARRLRRAVRDHGGPAGHHPPARPAAARVPAARGGGAGGGGEGGRASSSSWCAGASPTSRNPTRCWACAAAGSASCSPRSTRCRPAPSSRRPFR